MMAIEETSSVRFDRTVFEYGIRRSPCRSTVAVVVDPVEGVMLTAPKNTEVARLDRVVKDKGPWIVERLRLLAQAEERPTCRELVTGESIAYLGRHYRVRVKPLVNPKPTRLDCGWLVVSVDRRLGSRAREGAVSRAIRSWSSTTPENASLSASTCGPPRPGLECTDVVVKDQQRRRGSCDDRGVLRFNWRIIQAPMQLVDYVVAHEVVHLEQRDHTKAFWARLGTLMPDYEARKEALRKLGPRLEW